MYLASNTVFLIAIEPDLPVLIEEGYQIEEENHGNKNKMGEMTSIFLGSLNSTASRCPVSKKKAWRRQILVHPLLPVTLTLTMVSLLAGGSPPWNMKVVEDHQSSHISMLDHRHKYIHSRNQKLANQDLILVGCCISGKKWINQLTIYLFWVVQVPSSNQTWPLASPSLQGICVCIYIYIYIYICVCVHVDVCVCMHIYLSTSTWSPSPSTPA